jgi:glycosyltransferase involved in cell wall biosynthesis
MISACVLCYNDETRIVKFIESLKGIDDIVVSLDEYSDDKTGEIAESMGARVVGRSNFWISPTQEDIDRFKKRFGFDPVFTIENKFKMSADIRNEAMNYCKNDWVFFPDSDEIVTWDLEKVKLLLHDYDQIKCKYIHSRDSDGKSSYDFDVCKLFRKSNNRWVGRLHEVVQANGAKRFGYTDKMRIDHYQAQRVVDPKRDCKKLGAMEYAVIRDFDARTTHYLAREYFYNSQYEHAIQMYHEYLKVAKWLPEIVESHIKLSRCYWQIGEGGKSREHCLEAIRNNPQCKEAMQLMGVYYNDPWARKWRELSKHCTNEDSLFRPVL